MGDAYPSLKARRLLAILQAPPLGYTVTRQSGSHRRLEANGWPALTFAFHDKATIPGGMVRKILVKDVGLSDDEARGLLSEVGIMTSVNVIYHHDPDGWWADSPEVPGWSATAESIDDLRALAEDGIRFALDSEDVIVGHRLETAVARPGVTYDFILGQTQVGPAVHGVVTAAA